MALSNTAQRYGGVAKTFHWLTALLILTLIPLGLYAEWLPHETAAELSRKAWMFSLHKTLGVAVFFTALARIVWALSQPRPVLLNAERRFEAFLAEIMHWLLYGALVIVPLSGWISHAAAEGFAPIWWPFGQSLPLVAKSTQVEHTFALLHYISGRVLIAALLLHVAGALKHHFIDRDATLRRMLPGLPVLGPLPAPQHHRAPLFGAVVLWAMVLAGGSFLGSNGESNAPAAPALAEVSSDWQVQSGSIEISVQQFGSAVSGSFEDWTAAISFEEVATGETAGHVTTTISIPSLKLGSVTEQAMGADYFDAQSHDTAIFDATIVKGNEGYVATGTLTIKGNEIPLEMPFALTLDGDLAQVQAELVLDRRHFGIGEKMSDESSLGFDVAVQISLSATRGEKETAGLAPGGSARNL
ncbi:cytochrome b/b6 domain-containing protein [Sulfitobacter aestuarii]|uniref:Cytochrome b/b6 domain-containing protein n=1 Tax=Sulfitobacter aestuarii TaxID=2161676 RepID=A0ABW5U1X7_9RHOB